MGILWRVGTLSQYYGSETKLVNQNWDVKGSRTVQMVGAVRICHYHAPSLVPPGTKSSGSRGEGEDLCTGANLLHIFCDVFPLENQKFIFPSCDLIYRLACGIAGMRVQRSFSASHKPLRRVNIHNYTDWCNKVTNGNLCGKQSNIENEVAWKTCWRSKRGMDLHDVPVLPHAGEPAKLVCIFLQVIWWQHQIAFTCWPKCTYCTTLLVGKDSTQERCKKFILTVLSCTDRYWI